MAPHFASRWIAESPVSAQAVSSAFVSSLLRSGFVEQFAQQRRKFRRQHARLQRFDHALDGERLLDASFQDRPERLPECRQGFLEAAFTLAMEVDGCCV